VPEIGFQAFRASSLEIQKQADLKCIKEYNRILENLEEEN